MTSSRNLLRSQEEDTIGYRYEKEAMNFWWIFCNTSCATCMHQEPFMTQRRINRLHFHLITSQDTTRSDTTRSRLSIVCLCPHMWLHPKLLCMHATRETHHPVWEGEGTCNADCIFSLARYILCPIILIKVLSNIIDLWASYTSAKQQDPDA